MPLAFDGKTGISLKARDLHFRSGMIDTHVDTTQRLVFDDFDLGVRHTDGSVDIPRMREGGVSAIFFAIWVPGTVTGPKAVERAFSQIGAIQRQVSLHQKDLMLARTAEDIASARAAGRIAVLIGVEGGHMIEPRPRRASRIRLARRQLYAAYA